MQKILDKETSSSGMVLQEFRNKKKSSYNNHKSFFFLMFLFKDNFKQSEKKSIGEKIRVYNAVIRFMVGTVLLGKELHYPR